MSNNDDNSSLGYINFEQDDNSLEGSIKINNDQDDSSLDLTKLQNHDNYHAQFLKNSLEEGLKTTYNDKYNQLEKTLNQVITQNNEINDKIDSIQMQLTFNNETNSNQKIENILIHLIKLNRGNSAKIDYLSQKLKDIEQPLEQNDEQSHDDKSKTDVLQPIKENTNIEDDQSQDDKSNTNVLQPIKENTNIEDEQSHDEDEDEDIDKDKNIDENLTLDISENPIKQTGGSNKVKRSRKVPKKLNKQKNKQSGGQNKLKIDKDVSNFVDTVFSMFSKSK